LTPQEPSSFTWRFFCFKFL